MPSCALSEDLFPYFPVSFPPIFFLIPQSPSLTTCPDDPPQILPAIFHNQLLCVLSLIPYYKLIYDRDHG